MTKKIQFDDTAFRYIRTQLSEGGLLSSQLLLRSLETGSVITYLPDKVDAREALNFSTGGVTTRKTTEAVLAGLISEHLRNAPNAYAVFEDDLSQPGDSVLLKSSAKYFVLGSQVYFYLASGECDAREIIATVRRATSQRFIGILTGLDEPSSLKTKDSIDTSLLATLVANTRQILIGAYDAEGVLIWQNA